MPTWAEIADNAADVAATESDPQEGANKALSYLQTEQARHLQVLSGITKRNVIQYTSAEFHKECGRGIIAHEDMHALMTVIHGLDKNLHLDVILHSPGGLPEVTASLVQYLRGKFKHIRIFIPHLAMSAGCLFALGCDSIVMASHSALGPIDPQMVLNGSMTPAHAIISQFKWAEAEALKNPAMAQFYSALLPAYGPGLLKICENYTELSKKFATEWLAKYMLAKQPDASTKAKEIAEYLGNHGNFKSHGKHIFRDEARQIGLTVEDLEDNQLIQDAVLSAHHAACQALKMSSASKQVMNQNGVVYAT